MIIHFLFVKVLQFYSRQSYQNKAVPSLGLLFVFIEQANGLPVSSLPSLNHYRTGSKLSFCPLFLFLLKLKKSGKEPKVGAEITLGDVVHKTTVRHQID